MSTSVCAVTDVAVVPCVLSQCRMHAKAAAETPFFDLHANLSPSIKEKYYFN